MNTTLNVMESNVAAPDVGAKLTESDVTVPAVDAAGTVVENCVDAQHSSDLHFEDKATTPVLQRKVSFFARIKNPVPTDSLTILEVLGNIRDGRYRPQVERLQPYAERAHTAWKNRNGIGSRTPEERSYRNLKESLPAVAWTGTFRERNNNGLIQRSDVMVMDVDHIDDVKSLAEALQHDPHILFLFRSPGYHGLKIGVPIGGKRYNTLWSDFAQYLHLCYGVRVDESCGDISRLCFVSYDPQVYINEHAKPFVVDLKAKLARHVSPLQQDVDRELVRELLSCIPSRPPYDDWIRIIAAVGNTLSDDVAFELLTWWSPEEEKGEYRQKLDARLEKVQIGTLFHIAKQHGWRSSSKVQATTKAEALSIHPTSASSSETQANMVCAADVKPRSTTWLWADYIPAGHLTIAEGDPGIGKSTVIVCELPARLSRGDKMPGSDEALRPGSVILLSGEDSIEDTLVPRLMAANADRERIFILKSVITSETERLADLSRDIELLRTEIQQRHAVLVVIDPLNAYLGSDVDSYKDASVRQVLTPLAQLAHDTGVAIVGIRHWTKSTGGKAIHKGVGSVAYAAAARVVLQFARDPDDSRSQSRIISVAKSNLGAIPQSLSYHLESCPVAVIGDKTIYSSKVVWEGTVDYTADDLGNEPDSQEARGAMEEATRFLAALMEEKGGCALASEIVKAGQSNGFSVATLNRAKKKLGIKSTHQGQPGQKNFPWMWAHEKAAVGGA